VVSPFARSNFVDHGITDRSSILRFVEDNWKLGRIGGGSFDALAGSIDPMFDFNRHDAGGGRLLLDAASGQPAGPTSPPPDNACVRQVQALRQTVNVQLTQQEQGQPEAIVAAIEASRLPTNAALDRQLAAC